MCVLVPTGWRWYSLESLSRLSVGIYVCPCSLWCCPIPTSRLEHGGTTLPSGTGVGLSSVFPSSLWPLLVTREQPLPFLTKPCTHLFHRLLLEYRQLFVIYSALVDPTVRKMSTVIDGAVLMVGLGYSLVSPSPRDDRDGTCSRLTVVLIIAGGFLWLCGILHRQYPRRRAVQLPPKPSFSGH